MVQVFYILKISLDLKVILLKIESKEKEYIIEVRKMIILLEVNGLIMYCYKQRIDFYLFNCINCNNKTDIINFFHKFKVKLFFNI